MQFLLDATLGLINMEQNNTFRVLTVVSVIGIPPTLMASVYGMNFKHMPELDWTFGYPFGLAVIGLSALIPAVYFKLKGVVLTPAHRLAASAEPARISPAPASVATPGTSPKAK